MKEANAMVKIVKDGLDGMDEDTIYQLASSIIDEQIEKLEANTVDKVIEETIGGRLDEIIDEVVIEQMVSVLDDGVSRVLEKKIKRRGDI